MMEETDMSNASDFVIVRGRLVNYVGPGGDVVIPDGVYEIDADAFALCTELTGITIPESVTEISSWAFSGCTALKEISIPSSVEEIADWCFNGCTSLARVYLPKHIKILPNMFKGCNAEIIRI